MQQRLSGIQVNGQTLLDNIAYAPFGPVAGWIWGDGQQSQRSYDANGRLQRFDIGTEQRNLTYDTVGNITAVVGASVNQQFGYDALQRLTAANADNFELGYAYDANGNRTAVQDSGATQTYLTAPGSNRLVAVDGGMSARYGYDAFGQRVEKTATQTYQLSVDLNGDGKVTEADIHVLQEYVSNHQSPPEADLNQDGQVDAKDTPCIATLIGQSKNQSKNPGKAEAKGNNGKGAGGPHACHVGEWITATRTTQFVYDGPNLLGEYEASGKAQQETVWMGNTPVATLKDGQLYAVHTDQLGAPRALTDVNGTVVWRWEPAPFGDTPANADPDGDGKSLTYNLRFPGQYYDGETGNHYNYYRDYNPGTGRYIESDPIGLDGGLNTYGYVGGSPLSNIDPTGQFLTSVDAACMQDPQFCVEVMGQMAKNSAAMSGDPCLEEAAERLTDAAEKMAVVAMVTAVAKHVGSVIRNKFSKSMNSSSLGMSVEKATPELIEGVSKKRQVVFAKEGSEDLAYLEYIGAEANVGGPDFLHILLRENPGKAALLEEFLHGTQSKLGIIDKLGTSGLGSAETHVKDFMIRHQKMLGLSDEDIKILQQLRDAGL